MYYICVEPIKRNNCCISKEKSSMKLHLLIFTVLCGWYTNYNLFESISLIQRLGCVL